MLTNKFRTLTTYADSLSIFLISVAFVRGPLNLSLVLLCFITTQLIKWACKVPRPTSALIAIPSDYRFPSGHAAMSMITFGLWALQPGSDLPLWGAITLSLGIGWSRVWLGVHKWIDVIVGWIIGYAFLLLAF